MWISKKRWNALEKRVADLEKENQGRQLKPCDVKKLSQALSEKLKEECAYRQKYSDTIPICPAEER